MNIHNFEDNAMDGQEIIKISKCGDLFPNDEKGIKLMYKKLVKEWHPDVNNSTNSAEVFTHINHLYNRALKLISEDEWERTNYIVFRKKDGRKLQIHYDTCFDFELGRCFVTKTKVVYIFEKTKNKYYDNALKQIKTIKYADKTMKEKIGSCMPKVFKKSETSNGEEILILEKTEDVYPLKSVMEYFDNRLDARHIAWIMSRLFNLACFLKYNGLVHNGINLNNCFISPTYHSVLLLGGWWYTTAEKERMLGTTKDIFSVMSASVKSTKQALSVTDCESIKLLGRQLFGETNCRKFMLDIDAPKPFKDFLICGSGRDTFKEFEKWDKALEQSFGKREFVKMEINNIYQRKEG